MAFVHHHHHQQAPPGSAPALAQGRHRKPGGGSSLHPLVMPVSPSSSTDAAAAAAAAAAAGYADPRSAYSPYSATSSSTTATTFSPTLSDDHDVDDDIDNNYDNNYDDNYDDNYHNNDDDDDHHDNSSSTPTSTTAAAVATPPPASAKGVKTGRTPSRYDWSKYMTTIKRLYIDEDKTLREVLEIMEREHNFVATPRMVKTRLKKWGYSKNVSVRTEEVQSLMELIFDAESQGDVRRNSTEVTLATGRVVGLDRVAAHLRRKRLPSHVVHKASHVSSSSSSMVRRGRSPSPTATAVGSPAVFRVSEHILSDLHSYVYAHSASPARENMVLSNNAQDKPVYDLVISARSFITQDRMPEALALLRKAPDQIRELLDANLMTIPRCLFLLFINLLSIPGTQQLNGALRDRLHMVIKALVRYVAALATDSTLSWPEGHPLRRVLLNLNQADDEDLLEVLIRGYKCILLSFESFPDASTRGRTIPAWLDLGDAAGFETIPVENLEAALWRDYQSHLACGGGGGGGGAGEGGGGGPQRPPVQQLLWMAELERQKVRARGIPTQRLQELYKMTLEACEDNDDPYALLAELNCHYYLAGIYQKEDRRALAEDHMRKSIDRCNRRGETGSAARLMTELQGWLRDWGEREKVEAMQHEITGQMSNLGLDLFGSEEDDGEGNGEG